MQFPAGHYTQILQGLDVKEKSFYWIYMLRLANGSYYTGYTKDLKGRYRAHCTGKGAKITRSFPPVAIAGCWKLFSGKGDAMRVEARIKGCSRSMKQTLIDNPHKLQELLEQNLARMDWRYFLHRSPLERQGDAGGRGKDKVLILPQDPDTIAREASASAIDPIDHF